MVLSVAPRIPGKWIQTQGWSAGQPTPEFYRFIVNLLNTAQSANSGVSAILTTSEALNAGALVNISPTFTARNANASTPGREAHGFVSVAVASGGQATVNFSGLITGLANLVGGFVYLGTSPGAISLTAPTGAGQTVQRIGVAVSATEVDFWPQVSTLLAS